MSGKSGKTIRKRYGFEEILGSTLDWGYAKTDRYFDTFLDNLKLSDSKLNTNAKALLERYVANSHVTCWWYNKKVRSEKFLQAAYFGMSVTLLVLIPVIIYLSPYLLDVIGRQLFAVAVDKGSSASTAELTARLTTFLAGFVAAHRTISAWLNQRRLIGPYWKARSDLVNEIYALETEWGPKDKLEKLNGEVLTEEFKNAIENSLETVRSAVQTERTQFYDSYTFPDVKLSESLSSAGTAAGNLVKIFESASTKKQRALEEVRAQHVTKYDELNAEVAGLDAIIKDWNTDLSVKRTEVAKTTDPNKKKELEAEVAAMVTEIAKLATQRKLKISQRGEERKRAGLS